MYPDREGCIRYHLLALSILTAALVAHANPLGVRQGQPTLTTAVFARAMQPGEVVRLDVTCVCDGAQPTATAFDTNIALALIPGGDVWRGLIGIDVDTRPGVYPVRIAVSRPAQPPITTTADLPVSAKRFLTRRLRVADDFVDPLAGDLSRIARDAERLEALFKAVTPHAGDAPFLPPVTDPAITNFGVRSFFNRQPRSPHGGIDYRSPAGTPVAAPGAGRIVLADDLFFTGHTVIIDHGLGLYSVFAHFSTITVVDGDRVPRGAIVGLVGATGRVTGPHLHWGVRLHGARVDPLSLLVALGAPPAGTSAPRGALVHE